MQLYSFIVRSLVLLFLYPHTKLSWSMDDLTMLDDSYTGKEEKEGDHLLLDQRRHSDRALYFKKRQSCLSLSYLQLSSSFAASTATPDKYPMYVAANTTDAAMLPNLLWSREQLRLYTKLMALMRDKMQNWVNRNNVAALNYWKQRVESALNISINQWFSFKAQSGKSNSINSVPGKRSSMQTVSRVCVKAGQIDQDTKFKYLCDVCAEVNQLPPGRFPSYINERTCIDKSPCLASGGECKLTTITLTFLKKTGGCVKTNVDGNEVYVEEWKEYDQSIRTGCECQVDPKGPLNDLVPSPNNASKANNV